MCIHTHSALLLCISVYIHVYQQAHSSASRLKAHGTEVSGSSQHFPHYFTCNDTLCSHGSGGCRLVSSPSCSLQTQMTGTWFAWWCDAGNKLAGGDKLNCFIIPSSINPQRILLAQRFKHWTLIQLTEGTCWISDVQHQRVYQQARQYHSHTSHWTNSCTGQSNGEGRWDDAL